MPVAGVALGKTFNDAEQRIEKHGEPDHGVNRDYPFAIGVGRVIYAILEHRFKVNNKKASVENKFDELRFAVYE